MRDIKNGTIIRAENLDKSVNGPAGTLRILQDINLSIERSEAVAVVGVSGSGKSTLLGLLAGLDLPSHGRVLLNGADLNTLDEDGRAQLRGREVGFVFQTFQLLASLTALENVMLPLELAGHADPEGEARDELGRVGLAQRLGHYPNQLSGGEQQRVAIARAFAGTPSILFCDEPTGNLDQKTAHQVMRLLFGLNSERGTTLVLVTHDTGIAAECDRVLTLAGGRLVQAAAA